MEIPNRHAKYYPGLAAYRVSVKRKTRPSHSGNIQWLRRYYYISENSAYRSVSKPSISESIAPLDIPQARRYFSFHPQLPGESAPEPRRRHRPKSPSAVPGNKAGHLRNSRARPLPMIRHLRFSYTIYRENFRTKKAAVRRLQLAADASEVSPGFIAAILFPFTCSAATIRGCRRKNHAVAHHSTECSGTGCLFGTVGRQRPCTCVLQSGRIFRRIDLFFHKRYRFNYLFTRVGSGNLRQKIPFRHSFSIDLHLRSKPESACLPGFRPHSFIETANNIAFQTKRVLFSKIGTNPFPSLSRTFEIGNPRNGSGTLTPPPTYRRTYSGESHNTVSRRPSGTKAYSPQASNRHNENIGSSAGNFRYT